MTQSTCAKIETLAISALLLTAIFSPAWSKAQPGEIERNCRKLDSMLDTGRDQAAYVMLTALLKKRANENQYLYRRIRYYRGQKNYPLALADVATCLKSNPKDGEAYRQQGMAYAELNENKKARIAFNKCLQINPRWADVYLQKGNLDIKEHHLESAAANDRKGLECDPSNSTGWINYAMALFQMNRRDEAVTAINQAIALSGHDPSFCNNIANLYCDMGKLPEALSEENHFIKAYPNHPIGYSSRSAIQWKLGHKDEAIKDASKAIELSQGKDTVCLCNRAALNIELKKYKEAIADLKQVLTIDKNSGMAYQLIALCHFRLQHYQEAITAATTGLELNRHLSYCMKIRAYCYKALGQLDKFQADLDRVNVMKPSADVYREQAGIAARQGFFEQALDDLSAAGATQGTTAEQTAISTKSPNINSKDYNKLLALYDKMIKAHPENSEQYYDRALTLLAADKTKPACADLEHYLKSTGGKSRNSVPALTWLILAYRKLGQEAQVKDLLANLKSADKTLLSSPELLYLQNKMSAKDFLKYRSGGAAGTFSVTVVGLNLLYSGKVKEGLEYLKLVKEQGDTNMDEYALAVTELTRHRQ